MAFTWCKSKNQDFGGAKNSKGHNNRKCVFKKNTEWFGYKSIDPICY